MTESGSKGKAVIQLTLDSIENNDIDTLSDVLTSLPYGQLDEQHYYSLLIRLLEKAAENDRDTAALLILDSFVKNDPVRDNGDGDVYRLPLFTSLFLRRSVSRDLLDFLVRINNNYSLVDHLFAIISYDEPPQVQDACYRLVNAYGDTTYNSYKELLDIAKQKENITLESFILDRMKVLAAFAPKPSWVKNFKMFQPGVTITSGDEADELSTGEIPDEDSLTIPEQEIYVYSLPDVNDAVKELTAGLESLGITTKDVMKSRELLARTYAIATVEEKYELLNPIRKSKARQNLEPDKRLFRILGPCNPQLDADLDLDHVCYRFGGCRMFTCVEFEHWDDFDPDIELGEPDWFTGNCDWCTLKIPNRYYAVRRPLSRGGWQGCYCSITCLKEEVDETYSNDILGTELVKIVELQLNSYGIQDRKVTEPVEEEST